MESLRSPMKRLPNGSSPNSRHEVSQVPRGTPPLWLTRWQLAVSLQDRLEMIYGGSVRRTSMRLLTGSRSYQDLVRRYSNDSML